MSLEDAHLDTEQSNKEEDGLANEIGRFEMMKKSFDEAMQATLEKRNNSLNTEEENRVLDQDIQHYRVKWQDADTKRLQAVGKWEKMTGKSWG